MLETMGHHAAIQSCRVGSLEIGSGWSLERKHRGRSQIDTGPQKLSFVGLRQPGLYTPARSVLE